nr:hypothetical protein [Acinetobacter venetianus]
MIRDFYLQRKAFQIAEKRGDSNDISFVGDSDDLDDGSSEEQ